MELFGMASKEAIARHEHYLPIRRRYSTRGRTPAVTTVIKQQPGGAQSRLVRCDDGKLYVLKMNPNPQGPNVLANEALGATLIRGLGLPAPAWRPLKIDLKTVGLFPELAMHTSAHKTSFPACGLHFGSEYLGGPQVDLYDFMPKSCAYKLRSTEQFLAIYLFDVWASHQDERQCVYQRTHGTGLYDTYFIDNGHLFGGPAWSEVTGHPRGVCSGYVVAPAWSDPRIEPWLKIFEDRIPALLHHAVRSIPGYWYDGDIHALSTCLLGRLKSIRSLVSREIFEAARNIGANIRLS